MQRIRLDRVDQPPLARLGCIAEPCQDQATDRQHDQAGKTQPADTAEPRIGGKRKQHMLQRARERTDDDAEQPRPRTHDDRETDERALARAQPAADVPRHDAGPR
jgi:hypothetical protein